MSTGQRSQIRVVLLVFAVRGERQPARLMHFVLAATEDIPGAKKRAPAPAPAPAPSHQGTSSLDWAAPLVWSGYQLKKRSTNPDEVHTAYPVSGALAVPVPNIA